ncbi:MAG: hypothetical protein H8E15_12185 [Planctomycetes bacterium]|nr:hypothetical protein [Planctomycetota bacterium]
MRFVGPLIVLVLAITVYYVINEPEPLDALDTATPPAAVPDTTATTAKVEKQSGDAGPFLRAGVKPNQLSKEDAKEIETDPVETGNCTLEIKFFDAEDFSPVSGQAQLWRLGSPGNDYWSNGDQLQVDALAKQGLLTIENLPAGKYRLHPLFARNGSPANPEFEVSGDFTQFDCAVEMPGKDDVGVKIYRPDKTLLFVTNEQVQTKRLGWRLSGRPVDPSWIKGRVEKSTGQESPPRISEKKGSGSKRPWSQQTVSDLGVRFGDLVEGNRQSMRIYRFQIRKGTQSSMRLNLPHSGRSTEYVALYIEPADLQASLIFPEGQEVQELSKNFIIESTALPLDVENGATLDTVLPQVEVEINFLAVGFDAVNFKWRPADGPLPKIPLKLIGSDG